MKLQRTFEWGHNWNKSGSREVVGWKPIDAPAWFDHGSEIFLAHDTMEHLQPSDTSLEAEFRASGAGIAIRIEGSLSRYDEDRWVEVLAEDATMFALIDTRPLPEPTVTVPALPPALERIMEREFAPAMARTIERVNDQMALRGDDPIIHWRGEDAKKRCKIAMQWMRIGYVEASEVYAKLEPAKRLSVFRNLRRTGESMTEGHMAMDGDRITVTVDTDTGLGNLDYTENTEWSYDQRYKAMMKRMFAGIPIQFG